jgi:spore coat protein U-like protein
MRTKIMFLLLAFFISGISWAGCSVTPPQVSLGQYDPATSTSGVRGIFNLSITCSEVTGFTVTAGPSQTTGSISSRQLRGENPSSLLNYQLCLDGNWGGACNIVFGSPPDGTAITGSISRAGSTIVVIFWALVYGNQPAMPGWHDDYVVITVSP